MWYSKLYSEEEINIIRLFRTKGVGINKFHTLIKNYGSATNFINNSFLYGGRKPLDIVSKDFVLEEVENTKKLNSTIITYLSKDYPQQLLNTDDFPPVLTVRGNIDLLKKQKTVAIIGSRTTSINNFNFTKKIACELGQYGYVVISGLARGIDSASHLGSLKTGTIAVMAGGIGRIYPKENENLYYDIIENGGCIITENYLDCPPIPEMFPLRNRIIAGLSRGVIVVDAKLMSGSLHTAGQAIKYNKELMVFPGSPYDDRSSGSNKLIQQGANMVLDTRDILECLEQAYELNDNRFNKETYVKVNDFTENVQQTPVEKKKVVKEKTVEEKAPATIEEYLISLLDRTPIAMNILIEEATKTYPINKINATLMKLKLEEKVVIEANQIYLGL